MLIINAMIFYAGCQKYNANYIATAHHLNDNAETILLNLIRGSNLYGYGGINITQKEIILLL